MLAIFNHGKFREYFPFYRILVGVVDVVFATVIVEKCKEQPK